MEGPVSSSGRWGEALALAVGTSADGRPPRSVRRDRAGFRVRITALNSDEDIDRLNTTPTALAGRFPLRPRN